MKKIILSLTLLIAIVLVGYSQKNKTKPVASGKISLTPDKWSFKEGKVEFVEYKGRQAMKIAPQSGHVVIKDLIFKDGIIEYDIEPVMPEFAESVYFHRKSEKEQEIVYLRASSIGNPFINGGIQYCPYFDGVNMWDMYPQYQAPSMAKQGDWNHMKLVISGKQMKVYVNNKLELEIPKLEGREAEGTVAFEGSSYISNVEIRPNETEGLSPLEGVDLTRHESNYIRNWSITQTSFLPAGNEPTTMLSLPRNESFTEKIDAERYGFVNITRRFGSSDKRRIVWLKATITTKEAVKTNLQLGFSDEIWLYLNDQITYTDKNIFQQNMKKYPDGRMSVQNGSTKLNLKKGENELMIGVANDFYGWGIIARLESTEDILSIQPYKAPEKIAIENIDQYLGTYSLKDGSFKLVFTKKDDELIVQPTNQDAVPTTYIGNSVFKISRFGVELHFKLTEKKVVLKQNGNENEFIKE